MPSFLDSLKDELLNRYAVAKAQLGYGPMGNPMMSRHTKTPGFAIPTPLAEGVHGLHLEQTPQELLERKMARGTTDLDPETLAALKQEWAGGRPGVMLASQGPNFNKLVRHESVHDLFSQANPSPDLINLFLEGARKEGQHVQALAPELEATERAAYAGAEQEPNRYDQAVQGLFGNLLKSTGRQDLLKAFKSLTRSK